MSSKWLRSFITGVVCFCGAAVPAACQGATWDQIVPFTPEELWLMVGLIPFHSIRLQSS